MRNNRLINDEVNLLNFQILASLAFIVSIIISIVLTYDEKQVLLNKQPIFSKEFDKYLNLFNRIFALLIIVFILYLNYINYEIGKRKGSKIPPLEHQIIASLFTVIAAIIVLYVVIENWDNNSNLSNVENPIS